MKTSILIVALSAGILAVVFSNCNTASENVEDAQREIVKAAVVLDKTTQEYILDLNKYKAEVAERIEANQKSIDEFRKRIQLEKNELRAEYEGRISTLERKNSDMKRRMDQYQANGKENWEDFKREFNDDMEILSKAFSDVFNSDKK